MLVICVLALSIAFLLRSDGSYLIGREAYNLLRLAEHPATWDSLSYGGRFAAYAWGTPLLLSIKPGLLAQILPPILGFLSFLLLWGILNAFGLDQNTRRIALAITVASPPFLFLYTTLNSYFVSVFLALLGFYLFLKQKRLAALPFILIPVFNLPISLITLVLLFMISFFTKRRDSFWIVFVCTAIIATAYYLTLSKYAGNPEKILFPIAELGMNFPLQKSFSDLGGRFGLSIFATMLAIMGVIALWAKKYSNLAIFFSIAALTALMFLTTHAIFFMNFFICALAAYGLTSIINRGWESSILKNFAILVIACGLLFSSVSFINRHVDSEPSAKLVQALEFFKESPGGVAFSHYTRGYWLEYSGKKTVMDESFIFAPDVNERYTDSETLLKTRNLDEAMDIINKYGIKYIMFDKNLKDTLWTHDEDGLQFLLKYSTEFKKTYINDEIEIWELK